MYVHREQPASTARSYAGFARTSGMGRGRCLCVEYNIPPILRASLSLLALALTTAFWGSAERWRSASMLVLDRSRLASRLSFPGCECRRRACSYLIRLVQLGDHQYARSTKRRARQAIRSRFKTLHARSAAITLQNYVAATPAAKYSARIPGAGSTKSGSRSGPDALATARDSW